MIAQVPRGDRFLEGILARSESPALNRLRSANISLAARYGAHSGAH